MDWVKDDGGLLRRVSPFRYLRIVGYLLLPEAFRSLSRLSSALSAKASTICSFLHDQLPDGSTHSDGMSLCALRLPAHRHSVAGVGSRPIFSVRFLRTSWLMFLHYLGCLDISISFSCMRFSRYMAGDQRQAQGSLFLQLLFDYQMENTRFELVTSCLQGRRSPN